MLRFAPSPTGDMHIGNLRIALFNYIISKQKSEDLLVRIEDTDKEKNIEGKDQEILDILSLFGIEYSQVVYQSQNVRFHTAMALQLIHEKKAFSCFCSPEWLEKKQEEAKKAKKEYVYDGACENLPAELVIDNTNPFTVRIKSDTDSFVIMEQDKTPTYHFATAIDDMLSDISVIVDDEKHTDNAQKQEYIRKSLSYDKKIKYIYLPTFLDSDNLSVKWLLEEGYLPEAISNYLISTVIEPPKEIFSVIEAVQWLDLSKVTNSPAHFDLDTLKKINQKHLKNLDAKELSRYVGFADEEIGELAKVYLEDVATTKELRAKIEPVFAPKVIPNEMKESSELIIKAIKKAPYFDKYDDFKNHIIKESGLEDENFSKVLCLLLTGVKNTPDISKIYKYLKNYIGEIIK